MILNRIHDALDHIHAEEALKLTAKNAVYRRASSRHSAVLIRKVTAAAAACCAAVIFAASGYLYFTPVYAVSIDNGNSTELGINRFDRVVSVNSYGDDSLSSSILHMNYTDALNAVLENSGGAPAAVTVAGDSEEKTNEMIDAVNSCGHNGELHCYGTDKKTVSEAQANDMPLGKYRAYLELKQYAPEITPDDVKNMTAREIRDMIGSYTGTSSDTDTGKDTDTGNSGGTSAGNSNGTSTGSGSGANTGNDGGQHHNRSGEGHGKHRNQSAAR